MATSLHAETLSFSSLQIQLPAGWEHSTESSPANDQGSVLNLRHPDNAGTLKILSYDAPMVVGKNKLRNLTNVDPSIPLAWQQWGDYSGYLYEYLEGDSIYRQWWLVKERTLIFVTYQHDLDSTDSDTEEIDKIVDSMTAKNPC